MLKKTTNFSKIQQNYDGFIVDIWGVLHDGNEAFPAALECLKKLNLLNKKVILFSNAPRRSSDVEQILAQKNISNHLYYQIISSGELLFQSLTHAPLIQKKYFYIGPDRDSKLINGSNYIRVNHIDDAEFIIVTGIYEDIDKEPFNKKILKYAISKKLPLICANPDLYVFKNNKKILCAGFIAEYYESLKGKVSYFGKPFYQGYQKCQDILNIPKNKILAIGDSYRTDITGANNFGIDSLFIASGVDRNFQLLNNNNISVKPTFVMENLNW